MKFRPMLELVRALRSGRFIQADGALRVRLAKPGRLKYRHCCLGVACVVAGRRFGASNSCDGMISYMPPKAMAYFDFATDTGAPRDREQYINVGNKRYSSLSAANDAGHTFIEIAAAIRANWRRL